MILWREQGVTADGWNAVWAEMNPQASTLRKFSTNPYKKYGWGVDRIEDIEYYTQTKIGVGMLKRFSVKNFKTFREELSLDLAARDYTFNRSITYGGIVKNALIYGPNSIGKSCLGFALFDVISHLTDKKPFEESYLKAYKNLDAPEEENPTFLYEFDFGGEKVVYQYSKNAEKELIWEKLEINDKPLLRWNFFSSEAKEKWVDEAYVKNLKIDFADNKLSVVKYLQRNMPTGSIPAIEKLIDFVDRMLWYRSLSDGNSFAGFKSSSSMIDSVICKNGKLREFESFLGGNGINYKLSSKEIDSQERIVVEFPSGKTALFRDVASTGTKSLELFYSWSLQAFDTVSFVFIDEFDAFFHYQSAAAIVKILNQHTFQAILTSHNTYLMQNALTRPDCCYLMSTRGVNCLCNCTDKEIREAHNLEKMYIGGAFTS